MFSEQRVAQMAAYLLHKAGGRMEYIKVLKLLYLADRTAMGRWGESISGDHFVSMPHGPVLSQTYDLIKFGSGSPSAMNWDYWIKDEDKYEISLRQTPCDRELLDELSDAELEILDGVFDKFGAMSWREIVNYTHDHCAEWEDPRGSSFPISPEAVFRALGNCEEKVQALLNQHRMLTDLDIAQSALR
ncbi:MAG: Panacea domain-containing protein [Candidatus Methylumidiphilus sp.]